MMKMLFALEDVLFSAERKEEKWEVELQNTLGNQSGGVQLSDTEFGCMMLLVSGAGEEGQLSDEMVKMAYSVIEPKFAHLPKEVRPFP